MLYKSLISLGYLTTIFIFHIIFNLNINNILNLLSLYTFLTYILSYKYKYIIYNCINLIMLSIGIIHFLYNINFYILSLYVKLYILNLLIDNILFYIFNIHLNYIFTYIILTMTHLYILLTIY